MSFTRGDLLTKTMKLVKGQAKKEPLWLKAMKESPPATFPSSPHGKIKKIVLPEDHYIKNFYAKYPDSLYHDAVRVSDFNPPPSRVFAHRVLEMKQQGVNEDNAVAVADMEYQRDRRAKKNTYKELKMISKILGKKPPPNPFPSAVKEIQAEEARFLRDRFTNPKILGLINKMKEEKEMMMKNVRDDL